MEGALFVVLLYLGAASAQMTMCDPATPGDIYSYQFPALDGTTIFLTDYRNHVVLFINTACFCGFNEQFPGYNQLQEEFSNTTFNIIAIPTNQFGQQEPAVGQEILACYRHVRPANDYVPNFKVAMKNEVNGVNQLPLYTYLKSACEGTDDLMSNPASYSWNPLMRDDVRWNFEKFLVGSNGKVHKRYHSAELPNATLRDDIVALVGQIQPPAKGPAAPAKNLKKIIMD